MTSMEGFNVSPLRLPAHTSESSTLLNCHRRETNCTVQVFYGSAEKKGLSFTRADEALKDLGEEVMLKANVGAVAIVDIQESGSSCG